MAVRFNILIPKLDSCSTATSANPAPSLDALVYDGAMDFNDGANEVEEYAYDANGNMTMDLNRGIESITYDWNNMPREITFTSGAITRYTYDAAGRKLRAEYITPLAASANYALGPTPPIVPPLTLYDLSTVDYHGDCVLRNDSLEQVLTPNGYIGDDTLHYYIKDYQGNVRCVVRYDGAVVESNEYYPYGGLFSATASVQPYKYGAKELDRTHGLDLYDSEARWYDSLLGRTSTMDPLAEKYYSLSPYLWCAGNPLKFIDPSGKETLDFLEPNADNEAAKHYAKTLNRNNIIDIFAHGAENGKSFSITTDLGEKIIITESNFKERVLNSSNVWKNTSDSTKITIVLHVCYAGVKKDGLAQKISKELPNVKVKASTKSVIVKETSTTKKIGEKVTIKKSYKEEAKYVTYKNGNCL